jgi:hypothetical protein
VQVDACGNLVTIANCQWIAFANLSLSDHICSYVLVNEGPPLRQKQSYLGIWVNSHSGPNKLPETTMASKAAVADIPTGEMFANQYVGATDICNVFTANVSYTYYP